MFVTLNMTNKSCSLWGIFHNRCTSRKADFFFPFFFFFPICTLSFLLAEQEMCLFWCVWIYKNAVKHSLELIPNMKCKDGYYAKSIQWNTAPKMIAITGKKNLYIIGLYFKFGTLGGLLFHKSFSEILIRVQLWCIIEQANPYTVIDGGTLI